MSLEAKIAVLIAVAALAGCASNPISPVKSTNSEVIDYPEPGVSVEANLGDRLVAKGIRTTGPALTVKDITVFNKSATDTSIMTCAFSVYRDTSFQSGMFQKDGRTAECFGPFNVTKSVADGTTNWNCNGQFVGSICRDTSDGSYFIVVRNLVFALKREPDTLEVATAVVDRESNFVQELIYNGRVGDELRFVYRELSNDLIRPAFTQEVQYDFGESNVVGFKGLRLEILEANNEKIRYKLLSNF